MLPDCFGCLQMEADATCESILVALSDFLSTGNHQFGSCLPINYKEKHRHRRNVTSYTFFDKLHFFSFYDHLVLGKLGPLPIWRQIGLLYYIYLFWINSVEGHPLIDKYPPIVGKIYPIPISEFPN